MKFDEFSDFESVMKTDFPLASVSTMRTGGRAAAAFFPETEAQLTALMRRAAASSGWVVIGGASNVLFPDDASALRVIFTAKLRTLRRMPDGTVFASCGVPLTTLSCFAQKEGLSGAEFVHGIPGTVGGGVYMNAGAFGGELSQILEAVRVYDAKRDEVETIPAAACGFAYRRSIFMDDRTKCILGACFSLTPDDPEEIARRCRAHLEARREKQPLDYPSCGSAFRRPAGHFAGKLIEDCGLKGFSVGGAAISEKHAGFIINRGGASSADVAALMREVQRRVFDRFGVLLQPEIERIGESNDERGN